MIRGFRYYLKRLSRQSAIILLIAFLIVFSSLGIVLNFTSPSNPQKEVFAGVYDHNGTVYLSTYTTDCCGKPNKVSGITVIVYNTSANFTKEVTTQQLNSTNAPYSNVTLGNLTSLNGDVYILRMPLSNSEANYQGIIERNINCSYSIQLVRYSVGSYYSHPMIVYFGPNGTHSGNVSLYERYSLLPNYSPPYFLIGSYSDFAIRAVNGTFGNYTDSYASFTLVNATSNVSLSSTFGTVYSIPQDLQPTLSIIGILGVITAFVMTVTAILAGILSYWPDLTSGYMDLAIAQPTTRKRLYLDRYFATLAFMMVILALILIFDYVLFYTVNRFPLPAFYIEAVAIGTGISIIAMLGFTLLLATVGRKGQYLPLLFFFGILIFSGIYGSYVISTYGFSPGNLPEGLEGIFLLSPTSYLGLIMNNLSPGITNYLEFIEIPGTLIIPGIILAAGATVWVLSPVILFYLREKRLESHHI